MTIATLTTTNRTLPHLPSSEIEQYLSSIVRRCIASIASNHDVASKVATPEDIYNLLTKREYCYLSKKKSEPYKEDILTRVQRAMSAESTLPFYFDIGGGYHATVRPGDEDLVFRPGLGEVFILSQVAMFCSDIRQIYAPGAHFSLVIDNLCAALVNDISVSDTLQYCASLRDMIEELGLGDNVDLLVESEQFEIHEYESALRTRIESPTSLVTEPSPQEIENVSRFLGRPCGKAEAMERIQRYKDVIEISEASLAQIIIGVHMTQRASDSTIAFRPFPGGAARIQAGEVALTKNTKGSVSPFLLTSRNVEQFLCQPVSAPGILPSNIDHITYAEKIGN